MSKFTWKDDYKVGNDLVDGQHEHLFKLANKVFEANDKSAMRHCMLELFRYIRKHFKDEERLMRQINYPDYEEHIHVHNEILQRLTKISVEFKTDQFSTQELKTLMNDWLLTHILKQDMLIGNFMQKTSQAALAS